LLERLLENWLDNASERSYQSPFCQMLSARGHKVVHSTRHTPIELGKDVISVDPDGGACAFQLKGNPGSRITANAFRELVPQLNQLVHFAIQHPSAPAGPHKSYFVTNGVMDEDAQFSLKALNENNAALGHGPIELIERGTLLRWGVDLGASLWPSELDELNEILNLMVLDGSEEFPVERLDRILTSVLRVRETDKKLKADDFRRRVTSSALLVGLVSGRFANRKNHWALISAWVLFCVHAIGASEKHSLSYSKNASGAIEIALSEIFDRLVFLFDEVKDRECWVEGDIMVDGLFYAPRYLLLNALLSVLYLWSNESGVEIEGLEELLRTHPNSSHCKLHVWGEFAVPQLLAVHWRLRLLDATTFPDYFLVDLLGSVLRSALKGEEAAFYGPYEDYSHHFLAMMSREFPERKFEAPNRSPGRVSFFAEALLHLLVRTGMKQSCKNAWPNYSRLGHCRFVPDSPADYCLYRTKNGIEVTTQVQPTSTWGDLQESARSVQLENVPKALAERPILLLLYGIVCPHRATPSVIRFLGRKFNPCWFLGPPN